VPRVGFQLDTVGGQVMLGSTRFEIEAITGGDLRTGGVVLRRLRFGERSAVVAQAARAAEPPTALCAGVLAAATVTGGEGGTMQVELLALALAGAAEDGAAFEVTAELAMARLGCARAAIDELPAIEIDRLAAPLVDDGWRTIMIAGPEAELEPVALRMLLAHALLARAEPAALAEAGTADRSPVAAGARAPQRVDENSAAGTLRPVPEIVDAAAPHGARAEHAPAAMSAPAPAMSRGARWSMVPVSPAGAIERPVAAAVARPVPALARIDARPIATAVAASVELPSLARPGRAPSALPAPAAPLDLDTIADALGQMLAAEADLRGIDR